VAPDEDVAAEPVVADPPVVDETPVVVAVDEPLLVLRVLVPWVTEPDDDERFLPPTAVEATMVPVHAPLKSMAVVANTASCKHLQISPE